MKDYSERSDLYVMFHLYDNGQVVMSANTYRLRPNGIDPDEAKLLDERLDVDDIIRLSRWEMVSVLATWLHRNGVWTEEQVMRSSYLPLT